MFLNNNFFLSLMDEEDFYFQLSPVRRERSSPRRGHRSGLGLFQQNPSGIHEDDIGDTDDLLASPSMSPELNKDGFFSKPSRKSGGWAEEIPKSGKRKEFFQEAEDERLKAPAQDYDSDNDMPFIPDLDEVQEEDLATQVAQAPQVSVNRVATYKELDSDLLKHAAFATLDDIDLRALMKCLIPETDVKEEDEIWTWDVLFTEVTSELNSEWEAETNEKVKSAQ